ncbi:MAG: pseudaminic acid synthase, partial [Candidatus Methylomirabilis sp.]
AAAAGADAVKLQTYTADTMTLDLDSEAFVITDPSSPWHGRTLYDLYQEAHTPWEWHEPIFRRCRDRALIGFSSVFDESAVEFLESLDAPCFKIASFENTDLRLIARAAQTGKPLMISTGMATAAEVGEMVEAARAGGCTSLILLKCTSTYPASPADSHLRTIQYMREVFRCEVGLSDHTIGVGAAVAAVALGATVVEKHLTLDRADGGVDASFSADPVEFRLLVTETRRAWEAVGRVHLEPTEAERTSRAHRRSLYIISDLRAGDTLTRENVRAIRPGHGLAPKFLDLVLGRRIRRNAKKGTPLQWEMID